MEKEALDKLLDQAIAFEDNESDKAIALYHKILAEKEDWYAVHYNLGLIYKYRLDWEQSFKYNARAVEINPDEEAGQWNLGIAATMLKKWRIARKCWNSLGVIMKTLMTTQRVIEGCLPSDSTQMEKLR